MAVLISTQLYVEPPPVPFAELLSAWTKREFEPHACRAELERVLREQPELDGLLDPSAIDRGEHVATPELVTGWYTGPRQWTWELGATRVPVDASEIPAIAELIRMAGRASDEQAFVDQVLEETGDRELCDLVASACRKGAPHGTWPRLDAPGLYRREHACLAIRTAETTIVTDPQVVGAAWTNDHGKYPADEERGEVDVLVTHSHGDHWCLASALFRAGERAVTVPHVPAGNLLGEDLCAQLEAAEQSSRDPEWWTTFPLGDVTVQVLPFYGEQPTRALPAPTGARNWGSCYRFDTPAGSLLMLVDSGEDAEGRMVDAVARSVAERGPIDVVASCCFEFPEAINPGLPRYAFVVPWDELRKRAGTTRLSMTSGPEGLAEICRVASARVFLPYAHGFSGMGRLPGSEEGVNSDEDKSLARLETRLRARGTPTEIHRWRPGDRFTLR